MLAVGFGIVVAVIIQFIAEPVVSLFTDPSTAAGAEVVKLGGQYLRGYVWDCIFAGVHFCFSGYFCAVGKSGISFLHNIIAIVDAYSRRIFDFQAVPDNATANGTCHRFRLNYLCCDLRNCFCSVNAEKQGIRKWRSTKYT